MASTRKGYKFEKETEALAGEYGKRCYKSGGVGSFTGFREEMGDVIWKFPWMNKEIISIECKHGYNDSPNQKTFRIYREWFDKHMNQAKAVDLLPVWAMKFKGVKENGISKFVLIPFPVMKEIIRQMDITYTRLEELENEQKKRIKKKHS